MSGFEHSRRDDLESIGYILLFLALGKLPWQNLQVQNKRERIMKTRMVKAKTNIDEISQNIPSFIPELIKYARKLDFEAEPD